MKKPLQHASPSHSQPGAQPLVAGEGRYLTLFGLDPGDRFAMVKHGLPASVLTTLANDMQDPRKRLCRWLGVAKATAKRKVKDDDQVLGRDESERVLGLARLVGQVQRMVAESGEPDGFDAARWIGHWLDEANAALGGKPPGNCMARPTDATLWLAWLHKCSPARTRDCGTYAMARQKRKRPPPSATPASSTDEPQSEAAPRDPELVVGVVVLGNFRDAPQVQVQPDMTPRAWQIAEDRNRCRYLLCLLPTSETTRLTTPIVDIDFGRRRMTTQSRRRYHLETPPTHEPVMLVAMAVHAARFGLTLAQDVSEEVWSRMLRVMH